MYPSKAIYTNLFTPPKGGAPQVTSHELRVRSYEPQVTSREPQVTSHEPQVRSRKSRVRSHEPQVTSCEPQVTSHEEQVRSHEEQVTSHEEQVTSHEEQVTSHEPRVRRWELREFKIDSPESHIQAPACHRGVLGGGSSGIEKGGYLDGNPLLVHVTSDNGQPAASSAHDRGPGTRPMRRVDDLLTKTFRGCYRCVRRWAARQRAEPASPCYWSCVLWRDRTLRKGVCPDSGQPPLPNPPRSRPGGG